MLVRHLVAVSQRRLLTPKVHAPSRFFCFSASRLDPVNFLNQINGSSNVKPFIPNSEYLSPSKNELGSSKIIQTTAVIKDAVEGGSTEMQSEMGIESNPDELDSGVASMHELEDRAEFVGYICRLIMRDGEFNRAQKIVTNMFDTIVALSPGPVDPVEVLREAIEKGSPTVRMVQRRLTALKAFQAPKVLRKKQRYWQSWKWIVEESAKRKHEDKHFGGRLAREVLAVVDGESAVLKKRLDWHRQASINRANAEKLYG